MRSPHPAALLTLVLSVGSAAAGPPAGPLRAQTPDAPGRGTMLGDATDALDPAEGAAVVDAPTAAERLYGLSLIWREAAYNFPYFAHVPELDWDSAYRAAIPRVLQATSTLAYYRELQRFMALLEDGHSRVHLPDSIIQRRPFSSPWVDLEAVGGRPMVANVATALADSLPVGSEIVAVEGMAVDDYIERRVLPWVFASAPHARRISAVEGSHTRGYGVLVGRAGEPVRVRAATPAGDAVELTLARDRFDVSGRGHARRRTPTSLRWPSTGPRPVSRTWS